MTYKEFLETKIELATDSGFTVDKDKINKALKPHQRDAVGVKQEFTHDAVTVLGYEKPEYCRTMEEVEQSTSQIVLTNYERVRDVDRN